MTLAATVGLFNFGLSCHVDLKPLGRVYCLLPRLFGDYLAIGCRRYFATNDSELGEVFPPHIFSRLRNDGLVHHSRDIYRLHRSKAWNERTVIGGNK